MIVDTENPHWLIKLTLVTQTIPEVHVLKSVTLCISVFWIPETLLLFCVVLESSVSRSKAASESQQESFRSALTEDGL